MKLQTEVVPKFAVLMWDALVELNKPSLPNYCARGRGIMLSGFKCLLSAEGVIFGRGIR